ncbi:MAG: hypothetical protein AABY13_03550, partial [Nanoarchaeota archaeon]
FVSLKYTRTVDVIKNIIERLISTIDFGFDVLLHHAKKTKKIAEVPTIPRLRVDALRELYTNDTTVQTFIEFYQKLKRIDKARFERSQEYRRHVTMTAYLEEGPIEITIDIINDYFEKTKEFVTYTKTLVLGGKND